MAIRTQEDFEKAFKEYKDKIPNSENRDQSKLFSEFMSNYSFQILYASSKEGLVESLEHYLYDRHKELLFRDPTNKDSFVAISVRELDGKSNLKYKKCYTPEIMKKYFKKMLVK